MNRLLALALCLAAAWSLYWLGIEFFLAWYSGIEPAMVERPVMAWVSCGLQTFVNAAALALGWRSLRRREPETEIL